jgi:hypothetical protein
MVCSLLVALTAAAPEFTTITVKSPNGGETWWQTHQETITWTYTGASKTDKVVDIDLIKDGPNKIPLIIPVVNNYNMGRSTKGEFHLIVARSKYPAGNDYKVRIRSSSNHNNYDMSDGYFAIAALPTITITSPRGGETWSIGDTVPITWNAKGKFRNDQSSHIWLISCPNNPLNNCEDLIAYGYSLSNGVYMWKIPDYLTPNHKYKIRVSGGYDYYHPYWEVDDTSKAFTITSGGAPLP